MNRTFINTKVADAYTRTRSDIASVLDWIGLELDKHATDGKTYWGHVGELQHARHELINLLSDMSGHDPQDIKDNLDEMHS